MNVYLGNRICGYITLIYLATISKDVMEEKEKQHLWKRKTLPTVKNCHKQTETSGMDSFKKRANALRTTLTLTLSSTDAQTFTHNWWCSLLSVHKSWCIHYSRNTSNVSDLLMKQWIFTVIFSWRSSTNSPQTTGLLALADISTFFISTLFLQRLTCVFLIKVNREEGEDVELTASSGGLLFSC